MNKLPIKSEFNFLMRIKIFFTRVFNKKRIEENRTAENPLERKYVERSNNYFEEMRKKQDNEVANRKIMELIKENSSLVNDMPKYKIEEIIQLIEKDVNELKIRISSLERKMEREVNNK